MTDADKIRWAAKTTPMDFRKMDVWRAPEPRDYKALILREDEAPSFKSACGIVEFRREIGTMNGAPWARVIGKLRDTEVVTWEGWEGPR